MTLKAFNAWSHDIGLGGYGFMRAELGDGRITLQDLGPATSQGTGVPGEAVLFEPESSVGQSDWGGGIGQYKFAASDMVLDSIGDGSRTGLLYPALTPQSAGGAGGISTYMFQILGTAYGFNGTTIRELGTANTVAGVAAPIHQPVVSGAGNALWASSAGAIRRFSQSAGTVTDVSPTNFTAWNLVRSGKWIFAFGKRTLPITQGPRSGYGTTYASTGPMDSHEMSWLKRTEPGDTLVMFWIANGGTETVGIDSTDAIVTKNVAPKIAVRPGWKRIEYSSNDSSISVFAFYMEDATERSGIEWAEFDVPVSAVGFLNAYTGLRLIDALDKVAKSITDASNNLASGTTDATDYANETLISVHGTTTTNAITEAAGWTERGEASPTGATMRGAYYEKLVTVTGTQSHTPTVGAGTPDSTNVIATFRGNDLAAAMDRFQILYTTNDGADWHSVPFEVASGIEQVRCSRAALGAVWFTTDTHLYEMNVTEEQDTTSGRFFPNVAIGAVDGPWPYPIGSGLNGRWIEVSEGAILVTLDSRIRRYPPGATATDVWPAENWVARAGKVQAMVDVGGQTVFGANGRLYLFNGRGFQSIAEEPGGEAGGFDYLFFHSGRLYYTAATQKYLYLGYIGQRADLQSGHNFSTGNTVSSYMTFGKEIVPKVARTFTTSVYWHTKGTVKLYYLADIDPSAATTTAEIAALPWVLIGTHTEVDGPTKEHELASNAVAEGKRFWFRLENIPFSTTSYGIVTGWVGFGRALMPHYNRIIATLEISTGTTSNSDDVADRYLYDDLATCQEAVAFLNDLRAINDVGPHVVEVDYVYYQGYSEKLYCTIEPVLHTLDMTEGDVGQTAYYSIQLAEIPKWTGA